MCKIVGTILTYREKFSLAIRTVRRLPGISLRVVLPRGQRQEFEDRVQDGTVQVIEHDVRQRTPEGLVNHGALRHMQYAVLLEQMENRYVGLLLDDDLTGNPQGLNLKARDQFLVEKIHRDAVAQQRGQRVWHHLGHKDKAELRRQYGFIPWVLALTQQQVLERVMRISRSARDKGYSFFTFVYGGRSSNAIVVQGKDTPVVKWSGVLGVLPGAPSQIYDPVIKTAEDWDAASRILCDLGQRILADPSTVWNMDIGVPKYQPGGLLYQDRMRNCQRLIRKRFRGLPVFHMKRTALGQLPSLTCSRALVRQLRMEAA